MWMGLLEKMVLLDTDAVRLKSIQSHKRTTLPASWVRVWVRSKMNEALPGVAFL